MCVGGFVAQIVSILIALSDYLWLLASAFSHLTEASGFLMGTVLKLF